MNKIIKLLKIKAVKRTGIILLMFILLFAVSKLTSTKVDKELLYSEVQSGVFEVVISAAGELEAEKSIDIKGPVLGGKDEEEEFGGRGGGTGGRGGGPGGGGPRIQMELLEIQDMVPEGTLVSKGDYVAQLNTTSYTNTLMTEEQTLVTYIAERNMKALDTSLTLSDSRDKIQSKLFDIEKAKITLETKQYEAPATVRKAEQSLDKLERSLSQLYSQYELTERQQTIQMQNAEAKVVAQELKIRYLKQYIEDFTITAPADGMIVYKKNILGVKTEIGSSLHPFDLTVATLPDLTTMISKTHVSETEVTKLSVGQKVTLTVDAFADKSYTGEVIKIANVGEQLSNSDTKVFEVLIRMDGTDLNLRPAMTTWNKILINSYPDALFVPLDCVFATADRVPFVYKKNNTRQVVELGVMNDKSVMVLNGLEQGDLIYNLPPENANDMKLVGMKLVSEAN